VYPADHVGFRVAITARHRRRPAVGQRRRALVAALLTALAAGGSAAADIRDNLYGVKALAADDAWAVGNFGSIFHTRDGGRSWSPSESGTKSALFDVDFADPQHGWAVGKSALVLHTADGGRTWRKQQSPIPTSKHLFSVRVVDTRTVWAVGDWGAVTVTRDGGASWEDRSLDEDVVLNDVSFSDPEHGWVCGEFGTVLATRDGGQHWEKQVVGTEKTLFGVHFADAQRGWAVGIDGLILRTRDGGASWEVQQGKAATEDLEELGFGDTLANPGLYAVSVVGRRGVVVGDTGTLLVTTDGGDSWQRRELPEQQRLVWLRAASLAADARGLAVGANGFTRPLFDTPGTPAAGAR
jgi:photosystem II stability/assembly factor-like uncharacterized protein